jgi:hypothetical protein
MKWCFTLLVLFPITVFGQGLASRGTNPTAEAALGAHSAPVEGAFSIVSARETVVPITKLRMYGPIGMIKFGSGFCLDPECRFIVTNYHVADAMGKHFSIQHQPVVQRWLASGPNDEGATDIGYNPLHDLAVVELEHSLSRKGFHGLPYNMEDAEDLALGQGVDIYSFPIELNPRRRLQHFHGHYLGRNYNGLLAFTYDPNPAPMREGSSGGLIVDSRGRVMAVFADFAKQQKNIVLGVPVSELSAFVTKIQPLLAARLFPKMVFMPPVEPDHYPEWVPPRPRPDGPLERRPVEPPDVQLLRLKAQDVINTMRSLISVESFEWGRDGATNDPQAIGYYQVRIIDGSQRFREYPDGKKEMDYVAWPPLMDAIDPGGAWWDVPHLVAKQLDLQIRRDPDIVWKGQSLRVFQYFGKKEQKVCEMDNQLDFGFYVHHDIEAYDCWGEVWTDQDENIVRISENYHMPKSRSDMNMVVTFGWTEIADKKLFVPVTLWMQVKENDLRVDSHVDWCHGQFTDYQQFGSTVRAEQMPPAQK